MTQLPLEAFPNMLTRRTLMATLALSGCRRETDSTTGILRFGIWLEPAGMDPHKTSSFGSYRILELMYEGLLQLDEKLTPVPCLAEEFQQESPNSYWFSLRRNVPFHSGKELTDDDVIYSLNRLADPATGSPSQSRFQAIERIEKLDRYKLRIVLRTPSLSFPSLLARPEAAILPAGEIGEFERRSVGTGPFTLKSYRPHEGIFLQRNRHYWREGLPLLEGIDIHFLSDNLTRVAALDSGEVDLISHVPGKDVDTLRRREGVTVSEMPSTWFDYICLNNKRSPLSDVRVRKALRLATDIDALVTVIWFGHADPVTGWVIPPWHPYAWKPHPDEYSTARDVDGARRLLREAGVKEGTRLSVLINNDVKSTYLAGATVLESNWREVGIHMDLLFQDVGLYFSNLINGNFDVTFTGSASYIDPEEFLCWFETGHPWNWERFSDPEIDQLLNRARIATDAAERKRLYVEVQRRLALDHVPVIPYTYARAIYAASHKVVGFEPWANLSNRSLVSSSLRKA